MSRVQERMKKLDIKQVDMIFELRKRGITVQPPEMSSIIRGVYTYPKAKITSLLSALTLWQESKRNRGNNLSPLKLVTANDGELSPPI